MAWIDTQVARGGAASAEDYLAELVEKERARLEHVRSLRRLIEEARASGLSPTSAAVILSAMAGPATPVRAGLQAAIADGRASGRSAAAIDMILATVLAPGRLEEAA